MQASLTRRLSKGDRAPSFTVENVHGRAVALPDPAGMRIHLQFRRFSGCAICNLHLQSFIARDEELRAVGVREVVVFHSPAEALRPHQGGFPFDVVGDPEKVLYRDYGVEQSLASVLNPTALGAWMRGTLAGNNPKVGLPEGGPLGLPADFFIDAAGTIVASHYGEHAYDQWSFDDVLALATR